jgi:hypothetical protein
VPLAGEPCPAPLATRDRRSRGCGREYLVARDQQHFQPVIGIERREVLVSRPLDVEVVT